MTSDYDVSTPVNPHATKTTTLFVVSITVNRILAFFVSPTASENENVVEALVGAEIADKAEP
jgi:hypothetical protein